MATVIAIFIVTVITFIITITAIIIVEKKNSKAKNKFFGHRYVYIWTSIRIRKKKINSLLNVTKNFC